MEIKNKLLNDPKGRDIYTFQNGLLFLKGRLFVPDVADFRRKLLLEFHATPVAGHSGVKPTLSRLAASFYWPSMAADARQFICIPTRWFLLLQSGRHILLLILMAWKLKINC
uniref:Integrase zinc-binding domain-containing protein n=1 Tax=Cajanus cajan TaxID=3821 RepID=A0A151QTB6_CAJCA|nr:hypothetical protein KK1_045573 [Cajanus cajan]